MCVCLTESVHCPLNYADDPDWFTVSFLHNGFFCGLRDNLEYADSSLDLWDFCNVDTFSLLWIEEFIKAGGNDMDERTNIYWNPPGMELSDGVCLIENDAHILAMMRAVKEESKLYLLVDHTNFLKRIREDCIIQIPNQYLNIAGEDKENCSSSAIVDAEELEGSESGTNSEFYDNDYDAEDGDDDLFLDNIDKDVNENNEHTQKSGGGG
jgi:hypothetical protein